MPTYTYQCHLCEEPWDEQRPVVRRDEENACTWCGLGTVRRVFTPTATVLVPEHFRHDQSQFMPQAWDTAAWEARGRDDQQHAPARTGEDFEEHLERDLRGTWG